MPDPISPTRPRQSLIGLPALLFYILSGATARATDQPAYPPLVRPRIPAASGAWARNPIDAFVHEGLTNSGLTPSSEADRATLARRLSFDLTGLPPTPEQIAAFESDPRADAYERLVDRLLASPGFGERWASPWLDLVRYADSAGFEEDSKRPTAWRYRDWVIDALNNDLSYDQFLGYQLAADELAADQPRHLAALGFLRAGPTVGNERTARTRADELDDVVSTTSAVFLGLTVGCARCHNHKLDPIPTEDYYRLLAVFAPGQPAELPLVSRELVERQRAEAAAIREQQDRLTETRSAWDHADPKSAWSKALFPSIRSEYQARWEALETRKPAPLPTAPGVIESGPVFPPTHVLIRGEVGRESTAVEPGPTQWVEGGRVEFPEPSRRARSTLRRSSLALWMTARSNPLTARVIVNRLWLGHFGRALVRTPSDFGQGGEPGGQPHLLDWLACELQHRNGSLKAIHRLIVTSATYRQRSLNRPECRLADPDERLIWRYPLRRLDAESIRDAILMTSGSLNPQMGGPGVTPPIDPSLIRTGNLPRWPLDAREGWPVWRRSVYLFKLRSLPDPLLDSFDLPDRLRSCPNRTSTNTPTQALALLNSPFVRLQAERFAERILKESLADPASRVDRMFRLATGRPPDRAQAAAALAFLQTPEARQHLEQTLMELALVLYNSGAFLYLD